MCRGLIDYRVVTAKFVLRYTCDTQRDQGPTR